MKHINEIRDMALEEVVAKVKNYHDNENSDWKKGREISMGEIECKGSVYNSITSRKVPTCEDGMRIDYACILLYKKELTFG